MGVVCASAETLPRRASPMNTERANASETIKADAKISRRSATVFATRQIRQSQPQQVSLCSFATSTAGDKISTAIIRKANKTAHVLFVTDIFPPPSHFFFIIALFAQKVNYFAGEGFVKVWSKHSALFPFPFKSTTEVSTYTVTEWKFPISACLKAKGIW